MEEVYFVVILLIACWLILCTILSRFYSSTRDKLEIATTIADSTPLAIVIFRVSDGKIKQINLSAMTLIRVTKEDIDKINMWDIFISEGDRNYVSNAVSSNISVLNYEVLIQSLGGASLWSICSASAIEIEEQKCLVLAILDINRRKEIERKLGNNAEFLEKQIKERTADIEMKAIELEESNKKLDLAKAAADEANAAKSKFLTNMSNELKTPINAIIGYSEILKEEALDRKDTVSADDLRKIIGSAKHLLSLIDEILDLSKIEEGKTQMYFENIDIIDMIKDVEGVTMPLIADNDNSLFLEYPKDIGIMYTDSTKLRQCLLNLLSNAAKFTEFGRITLRAAPIVKEEIEFIEFSVIDTGIGVPADKIGKIFAGVQDGDNKSAGLGLSLTKRYTEFFGGTILVESTEGIGSKFTMRIPRTAKVVSNEFIEVKNERMKEEKDSESSSTSSIDGAESWI
jgi:PAS domain S-box-containing protein